MKHLILIGFMGCGKSAVSRELSRMLGRKCLDTDERIEREQGRAVSRIFAEDGEACFRRLETRLLEQMAEEREPLVISTGGGMAIQPQNPPLLAALGDVVYLKVKAQTVLERLKDDDTRPLLQGADKRLKVEELLAGREPLYERAAGFTVETDGKTPEQVAREIIQITGGKQ